MYFTPEVEDEVIRDIVSHKLYTPLVNPATKACIDLIQTKNPTPPLQIGDSLGHPN